MDVEGSHDYLGQVQTTRVKSQLSSAAGRRIHFAIIAIESGARKMGISGCGMYARLKAQNLIHNRLLARYEQLHTQSREWVADDIVETLKNWESSKC